MASVTDHGAADDPRSGATSLADWATAVAAALDDDDTTVDARIATSSAADQSYADGVAAAAQSAAEATAAGALASHEADTTNVHGIADTAALVTTARQIVSGAGLTGGGTLAADRTLAVGAGTGITVNADDVAVNTSVIAPLASPTFTGTPTAPTPPVGDASTKIATTAFVDGQRRVTHPNTDDVLVQIWDAGKGRWQTVHYDSGWRNLWGAGRPSGWASGAFRIRRVNSMVTIWGDGTTSATWTSGDTAADVIVVGTGFKMHNNYTAAAFPQRNNTTGGVGFWAWAPTNVGWKAYSITAGQAISGYFSYETDDAIPTSLPGTLVSAAPA